VERRHTSLEDAILALFVLLSIVDNEKVLKKYDTTFGINAADVQQKRYRQSEISTK